MGKKPQTAKAAGVELILIILAVIAFFALPIILGTIISEQFGGWFAGAECIAVFILGHIGQEMVKRKNEKHRLRYGDDVHVTHLVPDYYELPDSHERLLAAAKIIAGDDIADKLTGENLSAEDLIEALLSDGKLMRLDRNFKIVQLTEGLTALLENSGLSVRLPSVTESDILNMENEFVRSRRADGLDTSVNDLSNAIYLLRKKGIETVILLSRKVIPPDIWGIGLVLIPIEKMYGFCRLCDRYPSLSEVSE